ncbi:hypothetical protein MUK42_12341 [Musa troglodytarum]|uniref:START domain-containing protein n=1 Tax=Musa troglodytarum TaxID=320322 RepID=A0A9E7KHP5_9LILI|nr:hypothetical protein MUK42_12341 [Musa troglodytarum]
MAEPRTLPPNSARALSDSDEFWRENPGGGWATAVVVLLLLSWQLLRLFFSRRHRAASVAAGSSPASTTTGSLEGGPSAGISKLITDADLRDLMISLEGNLEENERWEDVIEKSSDLVSYKAKCCRPKDCEHPLAPREKKYVRVVFFRSGWCIREVPGRDACEITMVHQEDAGLNIEMAKLAFAKGIWSYVSKMNTALRQYSSHSSRSVLVPILLRLTKKVPPELETDAAETSIQKVKERSGSDCGSQSRVDISQKKPSRSSKKWIANGLLLLGGIICLSRRRSNIGTQLAMACILKKLMNNGAESSQVESAQLRPDSRKTRHIG